MNSVMWRVNGFSSADEQADASACFREKQYIWLNSTLFLSMKEIMVKHKHDLSTSAVGFFLIIILISKFATTGSVLYRIEMGVAYPALFILIGYNLRFPKNWRKFVRQTGKEFLILMVPSYVSHFFLQLYTYANKNWGSAAYWKVYMNYMKDTFYYSSSRAYGDVPSIGVVWILISTFFTRLIINGIWIAVDAIYRRGKIRFKVNQTVVTWIIYLITGFIGMFLLGRYIILPLNLSVVFLAVMLAAIGMIWKRYNGRVEKKWQIAVLAGMLAIGIIAIANNRLMDIGGLSFPGRLLSVVFSLCCIFPICYLIQLLSKDIIADDILSFHAKYGIILLVISELDALYSALWSQDNLALATVARLIAIVALCAVGFQTWHLFKRGKRQEAVNIALNKRYHKAITVIYYIDVTALYIAAAIPFGKVDHFISERTSQALVTVPTVILFALLAIAISRYSNQGIAILFAIIAFTALVQMIVRQNQNSVFALALLAGTSILASSHVIGKIIWITESAFILTMYWFSMNGYIPYQVVSTGTGNFTGHSFGTIGKNELAAFLLIVGISYCIARKSKKRYLIIWDIIVIGFNAFINYRYVGGRSDFALTVLLLIGTVIYRMLGEEPLRNKIFGNIVKWFHYIVGIPIYIYIMFTYLLMAWKYDGINIPLGNVISKFTDITTYAARLWLSKTAMMVYKPKLWGQYIYENSSTTAGEGAGYFWIDCSYVRMPLMYGIVATCIVISVLTIYQTVYAKRKKYYMVFLGMIIALMGIMGHRIPLFLFNPLVTIVFADSNSKVTTEALRPNSYHRNTSIGI